MWTGGVTGSRRIGAARGLPGGRAVVGALLVTAAAVTTFGAYLSASAAPSTSYLVASETIEAGTRFADAAEVRRLLGGVSVELTPPLDGRAIPVADVDDLVGRVVVAPLERGDLLTRTVVVEDGGVGPAQTMSLSVAPGDAVAGTLRPGERIDVLATYGSGDDAYTVYVVRGVPLLATNAQDLGQLGSSAQLVLTVAVTRLEDVQALGHAVHTAGVFVTRSSAAPGDGQVAPGAFRPIPEAIGPVADPFRPTGDGLGAVPDPLPEPRSGGPDEPGAGDGG